MALVAVDYLSKLLFLEPMPNEKADTLSRTYQHMFKLVGFPFRLLLDRGSNFRSAQFQDLCLCMNVKRSLTTVYHPECDGSTERMNKTLTDCLPTTIAETGLPWDDLCNTVVQACNSTVHGAHGKMPYRVFFGKDPNLPSKSPLSFMVSPYTDDKINEQTMTLKEGWKAANEALKRGQVKQKEYYDRTAKDHSFVIGDFALWRDKSRARTKLGKLTSKFAGPFEIVKIREPNAMLHTKTREEFVMHLNMLSAVTKELKESGQTVESTRK